MPEKSHALVISTAGADSTGAGGPLGVYGNAAALQNAGFHVVNLVIGASKDLYQKDIPVHFIDSELPREKISTALREYLNSYPPAVVWLHHYWVWEYFKSFASEYPFVILSGDPDADLIRLHQKTKQYGRKILRNILHYYNYRKTLLKATRLEGHLFQEMDQAGGLLACWCPSSVMGLEQRVKKRIAVCPLAFPDWGIRTHVNRQNLLFMGNLNGAHTRIGLKYFLKEIWPHWRSPEADQLSCKIRMVGGGKVPDNYTLPEDDQYFQKVGFVENLEKEWENSLALLVTVPVTLGFRTRILESWSKGVPVIAHPSAEASLEKMKDGFNYLKASNAREILKAGLLLKSDPELYHDIVKNARRSFLEYYSTNAAGTRYLKLSQMAIDKFEHGKNNS